MDLWQPDHDTASLVVEQWAAAPVLHHVYHTHMPYVCCQPPRIQVKHVIEL